jgi:hypothetical protein
MSCFAPAVNLLILLVILIGAVAIVRIILSVAPPSFISPANAPRGYQIIIQILDVVIWVVVVIAIIVVLWRVFTCVGSLNFVGAGSGRRTALMLFERIAGVPLLPPACTAS